MNYSFTCYGHENVTSKHQTTLEFTKDNDLRLEGDCIVGVRADFDLDKIKKFIEKLNNKKITITIEAMNNKIIEKITAEINPGFNSDKEMVIRKTDFVSERTFAIKSNKAAFELNKDLVVFLKGKTSKVRVIVEN